MTCIEESLHLKLKPKEKQTNLVKALIQKKISANEFMNFFQSAPDVDNRTVSFVSSLHKKHSLI